MRDMTYVIKQTLIDAFSYDSYHYARRILSFHINFNFGLSLNDLPDTSELCDISDLISEIIKEYRIGDTNENTAVYDIQMLLDDIDIDFIEQQVY